MERVSATTGRQHSRGLFHDGLERNADVVYQATYAPLFAHVDGWQWKPDLIWFDNLNSVRSANWYVQMLYGTHKGTNMLKVTENGANVEGSNGLYASAVYDKIKKQYIVKVGNSAANAQQVTINLTQGEERAQGSADHPQGCRAHR